jgi:hypothetical protein
MPDAVVLRWGRAADRVGMGALLAIAGAVAIIGSTVYAPWLAVVGTLAHVAGWTVLPAEGRRRVIAAIPSTIAVWVLLIGPRAIAVVAVPYLCWMLARHRPPLAWLTALLPAVAGVALGLLLPPTMDAMLPALGVQAAVVVGAAWLAAVIGRADRRRAGRLPGALPAEPQQRHPADS